MTEAELWEMMFLEIGNSASAFNALLTIVFAYLATGYLVGRKLTVLQALGVSVLFIWSATMTALSVHGNLNRALWFVERLAQLHPDEPFVLNRIFLHSFSVMATLSISVSLFFMYQIRRTPQVGVASA